MQINEKIKELRKRAGLTQQELAKKSNLGISSIQRYESGERSPNVEALEKIAMGLNIDVRDLLFHKDLVERSIKTLNKYGNFPTLINALKDEEINDETGYSISDDRFKDLIDAYFSLTIPGQEKAVEYIIDLTKMAEYRKDCEAYEVVSKTIREMLDGIAKTPEYQKKDDNED